MKRFYKELIQIVKRTKSFRENYLKGDLNMKQTFVENVHQSKFGWHPCDKETHAQLKQLNKLFVQAQSQAGTYNRWFRKQPQNRIVRQKVRDEAGRVVGYNKTTTPMPEPSVNCLLYKTPNGQVQWVKNAEQIAKDYRNARHPKNTPEQVTSLVLTAAEIQQFLQTAKC